MNKEKTPPKKRSVISYANMFPELLEIFTKKYPKGYADYMGDVFKVDKPDGTFFYAVSIEIPDAIYLVKVDVKVDDYEAAEKGLFTDNNDDDSEGEGFPDDDNVSNFAEEEDSE